jgi:hypothetical protein
MIAHKISKARDAVIAAGACLALLAATPALAQRPDTRAMSCQQAAGLVARSGAIVLSTGPDLYDRYVARETFCAAGYFGRPAFVPTRDRPQCPIGYYCSSSPPFPFD